MCVCSGIFPRLAVIYDDFSVARIIWDLSFPRYAAEAIYIKEVELYTDLQYSSFRSEVESSLEYLGYKLDNYGFDLAMMFVLGVVFRLITYLVLRFGNFQ